MIYNRLRTHSGISPFGTTMFKLSCIKLYFIILSALVVDVKDGDALTYKQKRSGINTKGKYRVFQGNEHVSSFKMYNTSSTKTQHKKIILKESFIQ